jgi:hypothetical protein
MSVEKEVQEALGTDKRLTELWSIDMMQRICDAYKRKKEAGFTDEELAFIIRAMAEQHAGDE